jgi:predicted dienelactone hydrolase
VNALLSAGAPLASQRFAVGRSSTVLVDPARNDRALPVDCWFPVAGGEYAGSVYELLPGVGFTASALAGAPAAPGAHPLVIWSHGRSGTRSSYAMLCEGLAARGYVVIAPDHPGDTLVDWLIGAAVDDATNEAQRVDDVRCVLDAALEDPARLGLTVEIDAELVAVAGHSYGAYTAFALAGAERADQRVRAVAGLQSLTRTLPASVLRRVEVPTLMVVGARDQTTPPDTDADRAFAVMGGKDARRVDIEDAGHQACSDVGLYLELAPQVVGLPDLIADFVNSMAADITGRAGDPWRPTVGLHLRLLGAWLDEVLERDPDGARRELDAVGKLPGVSARERTA